MNTDEKSAIGSQPSADWRPIVDFRSSVSKTLIVIAGPTAIGKTDLAIKLALHLNTEILSADSRQFYREMSIGTAKPSPEELHTVKHHFIDSLSVQEEYSAGDYETDALTVLDTLFKKKDTAILVGGSGLFINAVTEGFDDFPGTDPSIRPALNRILTEQGLPPLQEQLKQLDPAYYAIADVNNPQRVIRALEVGISTGKPFSSYRKQQQKERPFQIIKIGLTTDRDILYARINARVDQMMDTGLLREAQSLLPFRHLNALNTVGYTELFAHFDGKLTLPEAVNAIKQNTRRFAKRQLTWFRKDPEMKWFEPAQYDTIKNHITKTLTT